jgi:hypothetical protein
MHANVPIPAVIPACARVLDISAWCPALICAERRPEFDQPGVGAKGLSERLLESGVGEAGVRHFQKANKSRSVTLFHDLCNELPGRVIRLGAQVTHVTSSDRDHYRRSSTLVNTSAPHESTRRQPVNVA